MIRCTCARVGPRTCPTNTRQKRFATATGATRFTAIDDVNAPLPSEPIVPAGAAVAALLIRHRNSGCASAIARNAGVSAASMSVGSVRSQATEGEGAPCGAAPLGRPMPAPAKPPANSARASASPKPRDTPVTMAVFIRVAGVLRVSAMAAERERDDQNDDNGKDKQGDLDPALGILAGDSPGESVHHCLKRFGAEVIAEQPYRRQNVLEGLTG